MPNTSTDPFVCLSAPVSVLCVINFCAVTFKLFHVSPELVFYFSSQLILWWTVAPV